MPNFFVFCHLLNDSSGSPMVLRSTIATLSRSNEAILYVGSHGHGVLDQAGVPMRRFWYRRSQNKLLTLFSYLLSQIALYRSLNRANDIPPDATIFVNTLLPFGAMLWGKFSGRQVIVHVHEVSIRPFLLRSLLTWMAGRCAQKLIYVSKDHKERLPIRGPEATVIPNPVDPKISGRAADQNRKIGTKFRVLMLASLREYKGVNELIQLAAALRERADIYFDLVLNDENSEIDRFASRHAAMSNVTIHPRTDDPARFYSQADLVLNLSRVDQWVETFGLTLVEAMTFGLPVIAPPVGGPSEIVSHGIEGYCIDSRDTIALADAIVSLADNRDTYARMSLAAAKRADQFSYARYAEALQAAIIEING